jgi:hypothetical protein
MANEVVVKKGSLIVIRAKNVGHAIKIFESKFGHDLQWAIENEGYTLELAGGN